MLSRNTLSSRLALCGMLLGLSVLLGQISTINVAIGPITGLKVGLGQIPIVFISIVLGPVFGAAAGFAGDLIRTMLGNGGAYNPAFGIVAALLSAVPGIFFHKAKGIPPLRKLYTVLLLDQLLCSLVLNTMLIHWMYGVPLLALLPTRLVWFVIDPVVLSVSNYALLHLAKRTGVIQYAE